MYDFVLSGKYKGKKISLDSQRMVLFIKDDRNKILIDDDNVKSYKLLNGQNKKDDKTYSIVWEDGEKSIVVINSHYANFFISGCETGGNKMSDTDASKKKWNERIIITAFIVLGLLLGVIVSGGLNDTNTSLSSTKADVLANTGRRKWIKWNMEDLTELPDAETYIAVLEDQVGEPDQAAEGVYHIKGVLANNHGTVLRNIKLQFGLYINGEKVDNCSGTITGETERASIVPYDVVCLSWPEGVQYKILDISAE